MVQTGSFNRRLTRLEESVGPEDGPCRHPAFVVRWGDGSITGEPICPLCGRERAIINVVYGDEEEHDA